MYQQIDLHVCPCIFIHFLMISRSQNDATRRRRSRRRCVRPDRVLPAVLTYVTAEVESLKISWTNCGQIYGKYMEHIRKMAIHGKYIEQIRKMAIYGKCMEHMRKMAIYGKFMEHVENIRNIYGKHLEHLWKTSRTWKNMVLLP